MTANTAIQWTTHTFNPWWGCTKVSDGCKFCYAESLDHRYGGNHWGPQAARKLRAEAGWREPLRWDQDAARHGDRARVFCASMADVFEDNPQVEDARTRLWALIEQTPHLDWLLLTKRPENIAALLPPAWRQDPRPHVWLGTSAENQAQAERRIPHLLTVPAAVHFLSCEPLLGPLDLRSYLGCGVDWVITGGESGPQARPAQPAWFRTIRDDCLRHGIAFFHKQNGGRGKGKGGELLDGELWQQMPVAEVTR
jgi:protein gp37